MRLRALNTLQRRAGPTGLSARIAVVAEAAATVAKPGGWKKAWTY
jgi:hypothetical protein